ncbi:TetR/AcrR family transcriptional regulator C-terminal ligand-binding domain-containing protein [Amycolatopsis rubida]|uniref:DNA-binding transcriptional regulator, MarR family n=1 Tax=Amycolatopsis rubida TaxID=112413 RepID=A0A1I5I1L1_9PSEU|nr:TetR/AcrR family transcriptional regulator C-terminal ligand-binding domain-containing protein [Amycolatopsis rubida]SFO54407.1 DNA-binding transcriptional regulator, MarR family [Amycolatopsis rubida]
MAPETARRRHGEQLESALLAAGWDELVEAGYARLTMESVAVRARTSEAVLYRRWANKDELVLAAMRRHRDVNPIAVPDTGSLRGDLLAYLTSTSEALAGFFAMAAAAAFSGLSFGAAATPGEVRDRIIGDRLLPQGSIYQRAHDRGEIDLAHLSGTVLELPFQLVRHDLLLDLAPLRPARIRSIVDELFLPLVQPQGPVKYLTGCGKNQPRPTSGDLFRSIRWAQHKRIEEWSRTRELTFEQATVLGYLERRPGVIQRDVAEMSHTTPANVSLLLKGLERRGLVERRTEGGRKRVYATPAGSNLVAGLDEVLAEADEMVFAPLDRDERAGLEALVAKINAHLPGGS